MAGLVWLQSQEHKPECETSDPGLSKLWAPRLQGTIDGEKDKWRLYNEKAQEAYNKGSTFDDLNDLYQKDRLAYVEFCRVNGQFKPLLSSFSKDAEKPWFECEVNRAKESLKKACFKAFDALRFSWQKIYSSRLLNDKDYLGYAVSWLSHAVWKQKASTALRSIPQQILEARLEGNTPRSAQNVLSFIRPFDTDAYCEKGCKYVKKQRREIMMQVHPDKNPFPDASSKEEADRLANEVGVVVNAAQETLCDPSIKHQLC